MSFRGTLLGFVAQIEYSHPHKVPLKYTPDQTYATSPLFLDILFFHTLNYSIWAKSASKMLTKCLAHIIFDIPKSSFGTRTCSSGLQRFKRRLEASSRSRDLPWGRTQLYAPAETMYGVVRSNLRSLDVLHFGHGGRHNLGLGRGQLDIRHVWLDQVTFHSELNELVKAFGKRRRLRQRESGR